MSLSVPSSIARLGRTLLAPLCACILALTSIQARAQDFQALCDQAAEAAARDSLTQAAALLERAIALEPGNPRNAILLSNLATIQRRQELFLEAFDSYARALELAPLATTIWMNRASLNLYLERYNQAREDYTRALDLERDNQTALLMRAYIYMKQSDYSAARADYRHLLRIAPFSYSGRLGYATLNRKMGRPEEALEILDGMLVRTRDLTAQSAKDRATVLTVRAGVLIDLGRTESAMLDLEEAISLDNTQAEAYLTRGQIHLAQDRKDKAREDFQRAIALGIPQQEVAGLLQECKSGK